MVRDQMKELVTLISSFFFAYDRAKKGEITIKHMPTDDMLADFLTKPLQGEKFRMMRSKLLNM